MVNPVTPHQAEAVTLHNFLRTDPLFDNPQVGSVTRIIGLEPRLFGRGLDDPTLFNPPKWAFNLDYSSILAG